MPQAAATQPAEVELGIKCSDLNFNQAGKRANKQIKGAVWSPLGWSSCANNNPSWEAMTGPASVMTQLPRVDPTILPLRRRWRRP